MADANLTAVPMAASGYGKRSAPDQAPRSRDDFAHLPAREAAIAAYIDRLPDGAAVDIKSLAKQIPAYGQQAVSTALNNLSEAGHLRRIRETVGEGRTQWVTRSHFSRTARDDAWWEAFLEEGEGTASDPVPARAASRRHPTRLARSAAYEALVRLGRTEPRLGLSAAECSDLEPLAGEWLARGATPDDLVRALTAGLPDLVHHPGAFTRTRLTEKMPPEAPSAPEPSLPPRRRVMECTGCGVPGRPEALPGGLCRGCRGDSPRPELPGPAADDVRAYVSELRAMARTSR
ncbi:hypothetical protein [Streptomyces hesseae]|uniref:MarR family transcriptional regulator n=1 Tax=Streptomyces hesseae TaxID=3075519 RepID=A0ABU2SR85_9ACTN|nr:hypothetical protein [Streptomyces sp. DSM 40473]MDT0451513.1 hypothetical protein [Streptomyces sp. DSM 40473]